MPANTLTRDRLRRLADVRPEHGRVLSVFLSLDPTEFASPAARTTEINSVLNRAQRKAAEADGLSHEDRQALERDVDRVREALQAAISPPTARAGWPSTRARRPGCSSSCGSLPRCRHRWCWMRRPTWSRWP